MAETGLEWLGDDPPVAVVELVRYVRAVWKREGRTPETYWVTAQEANDISNYWLAPHGETTWRGPEPGELADLHDGIVAHYSDQEAGGGVVKIGVRELVGAEI